MKQKNNRTLIVIIALNCFYHKCASIICCLNADGKCVAVKVSPEFLFLQQETPTSTVAQLGLLLFCVRDKAREMIGEH